MGPCYRNMARPYVGLGKTACTCSEIYRMKSRGQLTRGVPPV